MKILIVEDDIEIAMLQQDYLEMSGFEVEWLDNGLIALERLRRETFDLVILDYMLPGLDGLSICRQVRSELDIPILLVTARSTPTDIVRGLGLGADDYIVKPFNPAELVARVQSHLQRYTRLKASQIAPTQLIFGELTIIPSSWQVLKSGIEVKLANREFSILVFLASHPNQVFSKEQIFEHVWGNDYLNDSATVAVHINRIREKIEPNPSTPIHIQTIWGAGYKFNT